MIAVVTTFFLMVTFMLPPNLPENLAVYVFNFFSLLAT